MCIAELASRAGFLCSLRTEIHLLTWDVILALLTVMGLQVMKEVMTLVLFKTAAKNSFWS